MRQEDIQQMSTDGLKQLIQQLHEDMEKASTDLAHATAVRTRDQAANELLRRNSIYSSPKYQ